MYIGGGFLLTMVVSFSISALGPIVLFRKQVIHVVMLSLYFYVSDLQTYFTNNYT